LSRRDLREPEGATPSGHPTQRFRFSFSSGGLSFEMADDGGIRHLDGKKVRSIRHEGYQLDCIPYLPVRLETDEIRESRNAVAIRRRGHHCDRWAVRESCGALLLRSRCAATISIPLPYWGLPLPVLAGAIILAQVVAVHRTADPPLPSVNSSANSARVDRNGDVARPFLRLHLSRRRQVANELRSRIWHPALRLRRAVRAQQP
jgi:hypothetical protein